jgi:arginase family enzyme
MPKKFFDLFGVPLDPWEGLDRLQLKQAYLRSNYDQKLPCFPDPYVALNWYLSDLFLKPVFRKLGRIQVESWLKPIPNPEDLPLVTPLNYTVFIDSNGLKDYKKKVKNFMEKKVKGIPIMVGVDHSSTGGVVEALTEKFSSENLSLIVLDSHSDFIPTDFRYDMVKYYRKTFGSPKLDLQNDSFLIRRPESYNSGNFIFHILKEGVLAPNKIALIGVSDYPPKDSEFNDAKVTKAINFYHDIEKQGIKIITKKSIRENGFIAVKNLLTKESSKNLYVSVDIDVGAISAIYGARQILDPPIIGLTVNELYRIAELLNSISETKKMNIVGIDIMETDVYKAGMILRDGRVDKTYEIECEILKRLLGIK